MEESLKEELKKNELEARNHIFEIEGAGVQ